MRQRLLPFFALMMTIVLAFGGAVSADEYKIGVLAKRGSANAMKQWAPMAEYLQQKISGEKFTVVPLDFEEVFPAVEKGQVAFLLDNSSMFVTAQLRYGATAIATMSNSRQGESLNSFGGVSLPTAIGTTSIPWRT